MCCRRQFILAIFFVFKMVSCLGQAHPVVHFKLQDNIAAGTVLGNISVRSEAIPPPTRAAGYFGVIMEPNRFADRLFKVDQRTSALSTRKAVDRDELCRDLGCCPRLLCRANFTVFIRLTPSTSVKVFVRLDFQDINDNSPFIPSGLIAMAESTPIGSTKALPVASDRDALVNGVKEYRLFDPTGTFKLVMDDDERPMLKLERALDADDPSRRAFALTYSAIDGGLPPRTGQVGLAVHVEDENDNAPIFKVDTRTNWVDEDKPVGSEIYCFEASDADYGDDNHRISYRLDEERSRPPGLVAKRFFVDPDSGVVRILTPLDYDKPSERRFSIVVVARDHGSPQLSSTSTLIAVLKNVNDNDPEISVTASQPLVEEAAAGVRVRTISVRDLDEYSSINVNCSLKSDGGFRISKITANHYFDIVTTRIFDHEVEAVQEVTVVCTDHTPPARTTRRTLVIPVIDVNDHAPIFRAAVYTASVPENLPPGSHVLTVGARDRDSGPRGTVFFSLDVNGARYFKIDPRSGDISVNSSLDRETNTSLRFRVIASDGGEPVKRAWAVVRVDLIDVNDNAPSLLGPKAIDIVENMRVGTVLTRARFYDPDEGRNGSVSFSLVRDNNLSLRYFNMTPDGRIVVSGHIDREKTPRMFLDILARDRGHPAKERLVSIVIRVKDLNDNRPRLSGTGNVSVLGVNPPLFADSAFNSTVAMLTAEDADHGANGTVTFAIIDSNATGMFQVNGASGRLFTTWRYPRRPITGVFYVKLRLKDQGTPSLSSDSTILIAVAPPAARATGMRAIGVTNVVVLLLILGCSIAIATALILAILWARSRSKRALTSAERVAEYLGYDPAMEKALGMEAAELDSEMVSNAELVTGMAPDPLSDEIHTLSRSHKLTPTHRLSHHSDFYIPYPHGRSEYNQPSFETFGHRSSMIQSLPMDSFVGMDRMTASAIYPSRTSATLSPHHFTEAYEEEHRQSDLSYEDSGKGGSVEDMNRLMLNQVAVANANHFNRTALRTSQSSGHSQVTSCGRETLC